jgi:hypothetical protein
MIPPAAAPPSAPIPAAFSLVVSEPPEQPAKITAARPTANICIENILFIPFRLLPRLPDRIRFFDKRML